MHNIHLLAAESVGRERRVPTRRKRLRTEARGDEEEGAHGLAAATCNNVAGFTVVLTK